MVGGGVLLPILSWMMLTSMTNLREPAESARNLMIRDLHARVWGDPLCLDLVTGGPEEGPELGDHPVPSSRAPSVALFLLLNRALVGT